MSISRQETGQTGGPNTYNMQVTGRQELARPVTHKGNVDNLAASEQVQNEEQLGRQVPFSMTKCNAICDKLL